LKISDVFALKSFVRLLYAFITTLLAGWLNNQLEFWKNQINKKLNERIIAKMFKNLMER
jgi:hypothetical protein